MEGEMPILLNDEEMKALRPDVPNCQQTVFGCESCSAECGLTARAQLKKVLDEAAVEDLSWKFRQPLKKEAGL